MYALVHKLTDKILYVDVMVSQHGTEFHASHDGDIPLIHSNCNHLTRMLQENYPEYQNSYQFPCMDDVTISDYEIRRMYMSSEELAIEEDS